MGKVADDQHEPGWEVFIRIVHNRNNVVFPVLEQGKQQSQDGQQQRNAADGAADDGYDIGGTNENTPFPKDDTTQGTKEQQEAKTMIIEASIILQDGTRILGYAEDHIELFAKFGPELMAQMKEIHTMTIPMSGMRQGKETKEWR